MYYLQEKFTKSTRLTGSNICPGMSSNMIYRALVEIQKYLTQTPTLDLTLSCMKDRHLPACLVVNGQVLVIINKRFGAFPSLWISGHTWSGSHFSAACVSWGSCHGYANFLILTVVLLSTDICRTASALCFSRQISCVLMRLLLVLPVTHNWMWQLSLCVNVS